MGKTTDEILVFQFYVYPSFSFEGKKIKAMNSGRKDLLKFLMLVGDLKHIPRTGKVTILYVILQYYMI